MRVSNALVRAARAAPDRIAAIEGERALTWREIADRVARIAAVLADAGIDPDRRVAVLAHNGIAYFEAWYAVPWCGGVLVPLNTRLAVAELDFQLRDAQVGLLLHDAAFAGAAAELRARGAVARTLSLDAELPALAAAAEPRAEHDGAGELAGIFYTGGTTGLPKGVMLSHGNLTAMAMNLLAHIDFAPGDVLFHAAPMFHLADIGTLFGTMAAGTHVFRPAFDCGAMLADFARFGVTHCFTVPVMIERLTREAAERGLDLSQLRYLGYGGSPMAAASLERARRQFPGIRFVQGYGQTEFPAATFLSPADHAADADPALLRSCGRPCVGYDIRILDPQGRECAPGEVGEIVGRGDNVMMGYLGRPEETAEVLRDGWLHTRDAGYRNADGYLFITDRLKDMIVSGAENVYSIEVENALSYHPAVIESAVIGLPDPDWGERVHAILVVAEGAEPPAGADLDSVCRERIAGYKIPKSYEFLAEPLPRSAAGKVLKRALRDARIGDAP
jgi:acyl-CoA synthetase (AMP-forming)/AMP-acid ligase II